MTELWEVMLDVARLIGDAPGRISDSGTTTTIVDAAVTEPAGFYDGGTLFITSGSNIGAVRNITKYTEGTFTFDALTHAIVAGIIYVPVQPLYTRDLLYQAVNDILKDEYVIATDETLVTVASQESYDLPTGVHNLRRVEVAANTTAPYSYQVSYHWYEVDGKLYFDDGKEPTGDDFKMRLWYRTKHGAIAETEDVSDYVDLERIKWGAVVYCYRNLMENIRKDNPTALDLLNEAKANEQNALTKLSRIGVRAFPRDAHLANY